jgi:SAM-dependent methyltransferase
MNDSRWQAFLSQQGNDEHAAPTPRSILSTVADATERLTGTRALEAFAGCSLVLAVGAGGGEEVVALRAAGHEAEGITQHWGDKKAAQLDLDVDLTVADMHDMDCFESGRFDAVYSFHAFEHALAPLIMLHEVRRVLRVGGKLVFAVPAVGTAEETGIQHYSVLRAELWHHLLDLMGFDCVTSFSACSSLVVHATRGDRPCVGSLFDDHIRKESR